jgi:hypothetical protein
VYKNQTELIQSLELSLLQQLPENVWPLLQQDNIQSTIKKMVRVVIEKGVLFNIVSDNKCD